MKKILAFITLMCILMAYGITATCSGAEIKLDKTQYEQDEKIIVTYKDLPNYKYNWIGIFTRGDQDTEYQEWFYTNGKKSGTMVFPSKPIGNYDMRLYYKDSYKMEKKVMFEVVGEILPIDEDYNVYYGTLHNHTRVSDGSGIPEQAYKYARDTAKMDFFGLSDHGYSINSSEWSTIKKAANAYNQDGKFVTFWGFEYTSGKGHITIMNSNDYLSGQPSLNSLSGWLSSRNVVAFFNHPAAWNFDNFNFNRTDKIVGMELFNKTSGFAYYSQYDKVIKKNWYIGAWGGTDNHSGNWGSRTNYRCAVLAEELTRESIFDAIKQRRFYSTADKNLKLYFTCNGDHMGSKISGGSLDFSIRAYDTEKFSKITLYKNGVIIKTWTTTSSRPNKSFTGNGVSGDYFYVIVRQADGNEAISSPIYIR